MVAKRRGIGRGRESMRQQSREVNRDSRERVQEPIVEQATTTAEVVAPTVIESVDGCDDWFGGVEVPEFVCRDSVS